MTPRRLTCIPTQNDRHYCPYRCLHLIQETVNWINFLQMKILEEDTVIQSPIRWHMLVLGVHFYNGGQKCWDLSSDITKTSDPSPPTPNKVEFGAKWGK